MLQFLSSTLVHGIIVGSSIIGTRNILRLSHDLHLDVVSLIGIVSQRCRFPHDRVPDISYFVTLDELYPWGIGS